MAAQDAPEHKLKLAELLDLLVADGIVGKEEADDLVAEHRLRRHDDHPLIVIAGKSWKSKVAPYRIQTLDVLTEWLAKQVGMEYFHIDPLKIDFSNLVDLMSIDYANRFAIMPLRIEGNELVVATSEPFLREWESTLKHTSRKNIRRVLSSPADIKRYLVEFYNLARSVKSATKVKMDAGNIASFEQLVEMGKTDKQFDANDQHIVHIVDWLWQYAFDQRASDIHIEPRREMGLVRFRIDGVLHQVHQLPMSVITAMTSRIKLLGRMDLMEKRRPQDGRIKTRTEEGQEIELRLSTLPTAFGEKLVMRIFDPEVLVRDFSELGFSEDDRKRWDMMTSKPNGIILVTGPTGSGKTTTLYSTLKSLATPEVNVCTLEDPIEMVEPAFNQMQIQQGLDLSFADGVRALMRQDPDIIMVGEIRDLETAEMAIQAALTGHLVLSTLHTNDAPSAITRLLDLGVPYYMINATLLGIMAQRLVRTLCPHCKKPTPIREDDIELWNGLVSPWKATRPTQLQRPQGCLECRMTGYSGRIGIYEILLMSPELRKIISTETDIAALREQANREGMKPLRISGALKVAAGQTTLDEVLKTSPPPEQK
ncbi:MAG: GspE/PulE family protein [Gammaproteobacteria bacterium]|nr:GspE/PulE family protein [Gammaproteobacteria bacterium]MBU1483135.1 GspE/PulE family protein [Gammaproteobacteria bacterium]